MNILITGGRSGIGYASAMALLEKGHFVYLTTETEKQLEALQEKEELKNKNIKLIKLDITNEEDRKKIEDLDIDVLINNASIGIGGSIVEADIKKNQRKL